MIADIGDTIEELTSNIKDYVNTQYQLAVLKAGNIASTVGARIIGAFILVSFLFLFVIFLSITAGFYLTSVTGSRETGFLIVALFYFLVGLVLLIFRQKLVIGPIRNNLIKQIFRDDKHENIQL